MICSLFSPQTGPSYNPTPDQLDTFWSVYCRNVDPIVRILHKPSTARLISDFKNTGASGCTPAVHALIMAVIFAAVNSVPAGQSQALFGEEQLSLSLQLQYAVEHALAKSRLTQTRDIVTLQAFTLFIVCRLERTSTFVANESRHVCHQTTPAQYGLISDWLLE